MAESIINSETTAQHLLEGMKIKNLFPTCRTYKEILCQPQENGLFAEWIPMCHVDLQAGLRCWFPSHCEFWPLMVHLSSSPQISLGQRELLHPRFPLPHSELHSFHRGSSHQMTCLFQGYQGPSPVLWISTALKGHPCCHGPMGLGGAFVATV